MFVACFLLYLKDLYHYVNTLVQLSKKVCCILQAGNVDFLILKENSNISHYVTSCGGYLSLVADNITVDTVVCYYK